MVPSIARQSVILKCNMQKSVLTGNYEFYYAAGLLQKLYGMELPVDIKPLELERLILEKCKDIAPKDERERWLLEMLSGYRPLEEYFVGNGGERTLVCGDREKGMNFLFSHILIPKDR